jgi:hypothetical protein
MNLHSATLRLALLTCVSGIGMASCHAQQASSGASSTNQSTSQSTTQKIAALQSLRDSGVISNEEYAQKVAALKAPAQRSGNAQKLSALKGLRDTGVISEDEYRQKVAALNGGADAGPSQPAAGNASARPGELPGRPTVDHMLPDQGWQMPWGTVKLPAGWGFNGGVIHAGTQGCAATGDSPMWSAESADKMFGVFILPTLKTNWTNDPQLMNIFQQMHCPVVASDKAADYLTKYILPQIHHDFRVVAVGPEPNFAAGARQMEQNAEQMNRSMGGGQYMQVHRTVDTARVLVQYQENGRTVHEMASALMTCTTTQMQMAMAMRGRPAQTTTVECVAWATTIFHEPDNGKAFTLASVEEEQAASKNIPPFFKVIPSEAWNQRSIQSSNQNMQRIRNEDQARQNSGNGGPADNSQTEFDKQQKIRKDAADYRNKTFDKVANDRRTASDNVNGAFAAHVGDYNNFTNPTTGQRVQLSNQYNNTYLNQDGTVALQTNSQSSPGVNWQLMTPQY